MTDNLLNEFDAAMRSIYLRALSECGYRATRFRQLVDQNGGLQAAKQLLRIQNHPEGLTKLWELGRLDLSMEALVLDSQWRPLFTAEEVAIASKRLNDLNYKVSPS